MKNNTTDKINKVKYLFTLEQDFCYLSNKFNNVEFKNKWLSIHNGEICITSQYSWDGCSPKWKVAGRIIGTPDGSIHPETGKPRTYYASLIHDALYQFIKEICEVNNIAYSDMRKLADDIFYELLKHYDFKLAWVYYQAVRKFGGIYNGRNSINKDNYEDMVGR